MPARFEELQRSVENWNSLIHRDHLVDTSLDTHTLRPSLIQQADLLRNAYDTAANLQLAVHSRIAELQRNTAGGERRTLALTAMLCVFGLVSMFRLCTLARRWRANSVLRDDVLRVVSHDLSNPLNTIQLAASMWQTSAPAARQPYPEVILRAVRRMGRLIQDLRDITAMESGHALALNVKCLELTPILEEVREAAECLAQGKAIRLSFDFPQTPLSVYADRSRLLQVFFNLVDNAIKFTPKTGQHCDGLRQGRFADSLLHHRYGTRNSSTRTEKRFQLLLASRGHSPPRLRTWLGDSQARRGAARWAHLGRKRSRWSALRSSLQFLAQARFEASLNVSYVFLTPTPTLTEAPTVFVAFS